MSAPALRVILGVCLAVGVALAAPGAARADKKKADSDKVDIDPVKHELVVLTDGKGHFLVVRPQVRGDSHLYYGDGKTFHAQRVSSGSADTSRGRFSQAAWAPRSRPRGRFGIDLRDGVWKVTCDKRETVLQELPGKDARRILDRASFHEPLWKHQAYALARDRKGTYYYVDRLRDEHGGRGFRLWVGQRGAMKRQKMINIVSDSEGDIFATRKGNLRLILDKKDAAWVKGEHETSLTYVPVSRNVYMIYAELGQYIERLGTPCDDL